MVTFKICSFGIGTLKLQKKHEKLFWEFECIFALLNLKRKINIGDSTLIASPILEVLSQMEIKLNWLLMTLFIVYMHGTCLTFGKPVREQYNALIFFNRFCEKRGSADRIIRVLLL